MSPTQFRTQCVLNWKCIVMHISKVTNDLVRLQLTVSKEVQDKFDALVSIQNTQDKSSVTEMLLTYAIDRLPEKKARKEIIIRRDQEVTRVETVDTPM